MNLRNLYLQTLFILLAAVLLVAPSSPAEGGLSEKNGVKVLVVEGPPREMGLQHGAAMKETIQELYKTYLDVIVYDEWIKKFAMMTGKSRLYKDPEGQVSEFADKIEKYIPDEYIQEMKGLAEGAGLEYRDVLNMVSHVDFLATMLCSTVVASGPATPDGTLVEGRNLDWVSGKALTLDRYSALIVFKPEKGHAFVSFLYPGVIGALTAINDAGITVELNFSMAKENAEAGLPAMLMVREIAQYAASLDEARKILEDAPRLAGYNITVADGKTNNARLFEITADAVGVKKMEDDGILVSTNHFITDMQKDKSRGVTHGGQSSYERFDRLVKLGKENHGKINLDIITGMIHDGGVKVDSTMQTVVFRPADGVIRVWSRNREPMDFVEFNAFELMGVSGK